MKKYIIDSTEFSRALYPGRFQPFHLGHLEAIRKILSRSSEIIVMIGSALESHTIKNPFTSGERLCMAKLALDEGDIDPVKYYIIPVSDLHIHSIWVSHVCSLVPKFDVVFSNEPLTKRLFMESKFEVKSIQYFSRELYSATEIRKRMVKGEIWETLLPSSVARYIRDINGIERLKELAKTDKCT